jgi:ArsR family transcriptional regulator
MNICSNIHMSKDVCDVNSIDAARVNRVQHKMPKPEKTIQLAEIFKIFGDPTRVKILLALAESELCVCEIAAVLEMSQSSVSHQLRLLRAAHLVQYRKQGRMAYYSLSDSHVTQLISIGRQHVDHL